MIKKIKKIKFTKYNAKKIDKIKSENIVRKLFSYNNEFSNFLNFCKRY